MSLRTAPAAALLLAAGPAAAAAPTSLRECAELVRAAPDRLEPYRCYWVLARQNRADAAEERLRAELRRDPANERARLYLARIGGDRGRDWAEPMYRRAIAGFEAAGSDEGVVRARLGLSLLYNRRHRLDDMEVEVAEAARLAAATGDPVLEAWVRCEEASLAFRRGDYGRAWRLFREVESRVVPDGPLELQALGLGGLAGVAQEMGRIDLSVEYLRRQAEISHELGDYYDEARALGNLVLSGFRLGIQGRMEPAEIRAFAERALDAAVRAGNRGSEARAHLYLGDLLEGRAARAHYREGLAIARETRETASLILGMRGLALSLVESEPRDPGEAARLADAAVSQARGSRWWTSIALLARARMRWITGPREVAVVESLAALDAIEAMRNLQDDELVRARVFSLWAFAYDRLVGRLLAGGEPTSDDLELAFAVTERMRARVLLDELDAAGAGISPRGPLQQQRAAALEAIAAVQRRLVAAQPESADRREALRELERLEAREAALRAEYARRDPAYAALRQPETPSLASLRSALGPDEAMLAFQVATRRNLDNRTTEDASFVFVHTRGGTRVHPVPDADTLRPAVDVYLGLFERRDGSESRGAARLYRDLLAQALGDLPGMVRRLIVVPDGALHRLPFATLRDASGALLGENYEISLAPSATLWLRWRRGGSRPPDVPALVFADPQLPGAAPEPAASRGPDRATTAGLGPLPHARREARAILQVLGGGSRLLAGREATEAALKRADLGRYGVLHLAAHALLDEEHPERSAVLLSAGAAPEDGLLQIREITGLELPHRLVVLSACRSASGTVLEGEGVMGLARAFFQAGARAVIGSLWRLRDDEAEQTMRPFYARLAEGASVGAALAAAQRDRIHAGAPASAWAGMVLLGDAALVPFPGGRAGPPDPGRVPLLLGAALLSLLAVAVLWRRRRRGASAGGRSRLFPSAHGAGRQRG